MDHPHDLMLIVIFGIEIDTSWGQGMVARLKMDQITLTKGQMYSGDTI